MNQSNRYLLRSGSLHAIALLALSGCWSAGFSQTQISHKEVTRGNNIIQKEVSITPRTSVDTALKIPAAPFQDAYILGPGDSVLVELLDVPEYSGVFTIGPDGTSICQGYALCTLTA